MNMWESRKKGKKNREDDRLFDVDDDFCGRYCYEDEDTSYKNYDDHDDLEDLLG